MAKTALIFGISGQDGALLALHLLERGYEVHGTSRDKELSSFANLRRVGIQDRVRLYSASLTDFRSVLQVVADAAPSEIYNLAGQSSVSLSFEQPVETLDSTIFGPLNILESIRLLKLDARLYNACSSECFGNTELAATEQTPFNPRSPYGVGKAAAFWTVANYRDAYGLFACSGILFNHDSPLRPRRFVTRKIVAGAADIAEKKSDRLMLGSLHVARDFGWAPEYVEAMAMMLGADSPGDYVIATGQTHSLESFVDKAFAFFGLDWRRHVEIDDRLMRPTEIVTSAGNPEKAKRVLGWEATVTMEEVVRRLSEAELSLRHDASA
ncbi:NAD-dependent epimerase/dehydratase [Rhodopseudomonas palustris HaA2]|uniref:GDP-mannose 4,6-dehydratase n=1 Tax=Rhodopseudomonas palustris (strain HaA2) TaxID=316058 RepID=Q2IZU8_RHOP2|nr:GDP-mannose 4,6-dehydratase [Rhodopseudomonas palustris]ABD06262.1 NAD-dependent epimerase/dehydratase [Rhodopseudomonas palustris HaA2]